MNRMRIAIEQAGAEYKLAFKIASDLIKIKDEYAAVRAANEIMVAAEHILPTIKTEDDDGKKGNKEAVSPSPVTHDKAWSEEKKIWVCCPGCGSAQIMYKKDGMTYQACFDCRLWLNGDGTAKPFQTKRK